MHNPGGEGSSQAKYVTIIPKTSGNEQRLAGNNLAFWPKSVRYLIDTPGHCGRSWFLFSSCILWQQDLICVLFCFVLLLRNHFATFAAKDRNNSSHHRASGTSTVVHVNNKSKFGPVRDLAIYRWPCAASLKEPQKNQSAQKNANNRSLY